MSTRGRPDPIASALFPGCRQLVLDLLLQHPDRVFYLREIGSLTGLCPGQVQREVERLHRGGIICRQPRG